MSTIENKVVMVTGASSGLGKALAVALLDQGARVAATFRRQDQADAFTAGAAGRGLGVVLDVTDAGAVELGVAKVLEQFGRIDVLANNAGAGLVGAIEETSEAEAQRLFDVNFFGGLRMIRAVLPAMRAQRSGHILQFSAIGGFTGVAGLGVYAAAKAATDILGEGLAKELAPLGINTTVLTIGIFETEFAGRSLGYVDAEIDDYQATPVWAFRSFIGKLQGKQPNDAARGAEAIIELIAADAPPVHAALGADAIEVMETKIAAVQQDLQGWESNARSAQKAPA